MRDTKALLLFSLGLFLLSAVLLCKWGYEYYSQLQVSKLNPQSKKHSSIVNENSQDSLLPLYQSSLNSLPVRQDTVLNIADSLKGRLDIIMKEFYKLRSDIATLSKDKSNNTDLISAREKVVKLQQKLDQLLYRNNNVKKENIQLDAISEQLTRPPKNNEQNIKQVSANNTIALQKNNLVAAITTDNLILSAIAVNSQQETFQARNAEKLVGSFTVKNNSSNDAKCDVIVVVLQPNGEVLQKSEWESGTFETDEGKKIYSCKISCEALQGRARPFNFSLSADHYEKGNYIMEIYHNGVMIGKLYKSLS